MNKRRSVCEIWWITLSLIIGIVSAGSAARGFASPSSGQISAVVRPQLSSGACTSICLDNGDHCLFGTNQDNMLEIGLLFVNKRQVLKTNWDPSQSGLFARWVSHYGSVTVNFVGYQMPWAGMNETGLMISTMAVAETRAPPDDQRPPLVGPLWMQYQLDNHSKVEQVIASDDVIRIAQPAFDHYLVCERSGACVTIEFLEGELVYHTHERLPVNVLTNNPYHEAVLAWRAREGGDSQSLNESLQRFTKGAERIHAFEPADSDRAVTYAFDTLQAVSRDDTVWSFVFDPVNMNVHFRTNKNRLVRTLDFSSLDFSCNTPVKMLDVHANVPSDVGESLVEYTHAASFNHSTTFFTQYESVRMSPVLVDVLLWGLESYSCQESNAYAPGEVQRYRPILPPRLVWAGLSLVHRGWPALVLLVVISLVVTIIRRPSWTSVTGDLPHKKRSSEGDDQRLNA